MIQVPPLPSPSSTAVSAPPPEASPGTDQDRVLFSQLADDPSFRSIPRGQLVEKAHEICYGFDTIGKTETISKMMDAGFPLDKAVKYAAAAAAAYCPQYLAQTR
ncbi:hypothetical protein B1R94_02445 [Mycolicibacterium litorale]|nr:hypothetical protein B1R94_02445 [Mycolicibacterium litorale]